MILGLLTFGLFGILGLSILCPLLALPGQYFLRRKSGDISPLEFHPCSFPLRIDIIIPAHNENARLGATLTSIHQSLRHVLAHSRTYAAPEIIVHVGADACTDNTSQVARGFPAVHVTEFHQKTGKWTVLKTLVKESISDWVMLVDAGTLWPEDFLFDVVQRIEGGGRTSWRSRPHTGP